MKKTSDYEYNELFLLGCIFFVGLFIVFYSKITIPVGSYDLDKNQALMPAMKTKRNINYSYSPNTNRPFVEITDDNETTCKLKDDIVSYTTEFYSIKLPYDLNYYTTKFGANKSSKQLLIAHKQLFDHLSQNGLLNESRNNYIKMLTDIEKLVSIEDDIYQSIEKSIVDNSKQTNQCFTAHKIHKKLNLIKPPKGRLIVLITKHETLIIDQLKKTTLPASDEAIIIVSSLNDHLVMLANKTISDYDLTIMNEGFDDEEHAKPVIYNIIERINTQLEY